uniref:Uncharacterized protein n=1 Tax=Arundo donax TaxID=35708 RepID=A0A0A9BCW3_ARUDO
MNFKWLVSFVSAEYCARGCS